jgi:hypothetical protein
VGRGFTRACRACTHVCASAPAGKLASTCPTSIGAESAMAAAAPPRPSPLNGPHRRAQLSRRMSLVQKMFGASGRANFLFAAVGASTQILKSTSVVPPREKKSVGASLVPKYQHFLKDIKVRFLTLSYVFDRLRPEVLRCCPGRTASHEPAAADVPFAHPPARRARLRLRGRLTARASPRCAALRTFSARLCPKP